MSDVEKQESQKTVVAFITGLLIGGLLVWVFSSSPDEARAPEIEENQESAMEDASDTENTDENEEVGTIENTEVERPVVMGEGSITVSDQSAGKMVTLGAVDYPTEEGWIVIRDYMNGAAGNILGAARFSMSEGLNPTTIDLIRDSKAGNEYLVMFYTNEGASVFTIGEDKPIEGTSATFKAN